VIGATDPLIDATRKNIDRALELDPNHPAALGVKALSLLPLGQWEDAVATAAEGVRTNPGSADSRGYLGFALASAGRPEEAIEAFLDAARLNPHHPIWYFGLLARALEAVGRFDDAMAQLRLALKREPDNFPAHLQIASLAARMGDHETSKVAASFVMRTVPDFNLKTARPWLVTKPGAFVDDFIDGLRLAGIPEG
jgi:tetratricopeptide (TPR) repeat protein